MRVSIPLLFFCMALLAGCHKNDVDIAELNTNPFDRDNPGVSTLFTLEPVQNVAYGQGTLHKHTVILHVNVEQFPATTSYSIGFIQLTQPTTSNLVISSLGNNSFLCTNYLITLGTEYCYRFEVLVEGEVVARKELCAMAEL